MALKQTSPLVGFNNNVKHKGRIFHVQTEDSGVQRPRIVTHLFADGGRIIRSIKTDYSEHVSRKDVAAIVRRLMKEQHKAMFIALRDGQFDESIEAVCGPSPEEPSRPSLPEGVLTEAVGQPARSAAAEPPAPPAPSPRPSNRPPTLHDVPLPDLSSIPQAEVEQAALAAAAGPIRRRPAPTLTEFSLADLGAPPEFVHTSHQDVRAEVRHIPAVKGTPSLGTPAMSAGSTQTPSKRYSAPRPAAIFASQPQSSGDSLFGNAPISEQSLDEVILSYIAEDLEEGAAKD